MLPARYDARVTTRGEATRLLREQHAEVASLLAELDDDAFSRRGTIGGGEWSAKDLALHLGSWEKLSIGTLAEFVRGERPSMEDNLGSIGAGDRFNDEQVRTHLDVAPDEARTLFEQHHRQIVDAIAGLDDAMWGSDYPFDQEHATLGHVIGGLLGSETGGFTHPRAHLPDLRAYVASTRP